MAAFSHKTFARNDSGLLLRLKRLWRLIDQAIFLGLFGQGQPGSRHL